MYELSLFAGAGGGVLGTHHLLGWEAVGYVEWNEYCQRVIAARIQDGLLNKAPIFGDVRTFISEGYAAAYSGMVDVITAGFPCQPFSVAGKQRGADDDRNMWPATMECIRIVRPRFAFLENVPGLLASGYFSRIVGDLAESGYDCRWRILSAVECGAPHKRDRLWIVANGYSGRQYTSNAIQTDCDQQWNDSPQKQSGNTEQSVFEPDSKHVAHAESSKWDDQPLQKPEQHCGHVTPGGRSRNVHAGINWWEIEPDVGRVVDGMAHRVDRLKALGNGQVPIVAATAWHLLTEIFDEPGASH